MKKSNVKNKRTGSGVSSRSAYEYGSTARQLNTAQPLRRDEETEESREQRKARQKQIRRNNKINLMYTMVVASVAAVVFFICYQYLNVQAVAKANSDKIIELKSTLNSLKDDNDALESDINASIIMLCMIQQLMSLEWCIREKTRLLHIILKKVNM